MKVLALNSSARTSGQSKTELLLRSLVEGMRQAGAEVETVNLREKKINVCAGCFTCWTKTPGECIHRDDMTKELFPKWRDADVCIYATPLFHHTVNATMKTFIERTLPVAEPYLVDEGDRWSHPLRTTPPAAVVISVAGFPAMSAFDAMTHYVNYLFGRREGGLLAEIYRPGAEALLNSGAVKDDILEAMKQAGRELVESKNISEKTMSRILQPLPMDLQDFADVANCMWDTCIEAGVNPKEFQQKGMTPRPNSIRIFMLLMSFGFNPEGAGESKAVLQYHFTGEVEGSCYFKIGDGKISSNMGAADNPDLVIKAPFEIWIDIMTGQADGAKMFMEGHYTAEGDMDLLMNMSRFFGRG